MPNLFARIDAEFTLVEQEKDLISKNYDETANYVLELALIPDLDKPFSMMSFEISTDNVIDGVLNHNLNGNKIFVICKGVFKVNVRSNYKSIYLDDGKKWIFSAFGYYSQGLTGLTVEAGLEAEKYEYIRQGEKIEDIRYLIDIVTAEKRKSL